MKANELMIGDWVKIKTYGVSDKFERTEAHIYVKLAEIGNGLITVDYNNDIKEPYRICENTEIEPIPLTPEILEKNGFKSPMPNGMMLFSDKEKDISIVVMKTNNAPNCNGKYLVGIKQSYTDSKVVMNYVHQLQHALRLCGIEKEIVL